MPRRMLAAVSLFILAACASGGASGATHSGHRTQNVITAQEISQTTGLANALDVVQRLRPQFLQYHGFTTLGGSARGPDRVPPTVFLNDQKYGDVSILRDILVTDIQEIRFLTPAEATVRWGVGYSAGVIQVIRKSS